ncbi:unnamed protein product [Onchocerca flexuosa]|uniref:Uncharacterized protein n=1 Tax=Onchocerca flexuosa TaxID=387005 RepID=A0A183HIT4_9BILA|nr:unnamed protein product [Onchocerca flexuosa]
MLPIDCSEAPPGFVEICYQFRQIDMAIKANLPFIASQPQLKMSAATTLHINQLSPAVPRQFSPVSSVYDCLNLQCLCPYFEGNMVPDGRCLLRNGQILQRAVRKEIRMLNKDEIERFFKAIQQLKTSGEYDRLAIIHRSVREPQG